MPCEIKAVKLLVSVFCLTYAGRPLVSGSEVRVVGEFVTKNEHLQIVWIVLLLHEISHQDVGRMKEAMKE